MLEMSFKFLKPGNKERTKILICHYLPLEKKANAKCKSPMVAVAMIQANEKNSKTKNKNSSC
jgi:hypothetical protein